MLNYDDKTLETLSKCNSREFLNIAPWICWESENSSYGKCLRRWAFYPRMLPIFACSPHGAHHSSYIAQNELDNRVDLFFGWPKKTVKQRILKNKKKSYVIAHPWIHYRKKYIGIPPGNRKGILYFFPHSNDHITPKFGSLNRLMKSLKLLGNKYGGISICLSFHDIRKGLHKKLRKYSLPLVTVGDTNSHKFIDNFYNLIYNYRLTCSSSIGSHVYHSIEGGIPHLFLPQEKFKYTFNKLKKAYSYDKFMKIRQDSDDLKKQKKFERTLRFGDRKITAFQKKFVLDKMGFNDSITRYEASFYLWKEFFLNFYKWIPWYFYLFFKFFKKYLIRENKSAN
jgi:hypothetical protein